VDSEVFLDEIQPVFKFSYFLTDQNISAIRNFIVWDSEMALNDS
jgi:hypothetical protein